MLFPSSIILAGKPNSSRHSTTGLSENSVVAETSYQIVQVFSCFDRERHLKSFNENNRVNFSVDKK